MVHDNGTYFTRWEFQSLLYNYLIFTKPATLKNPRSNAVAYIIHLPMGYMPSTENLAGPYWKE